MAFSVMYWALYTEENVKMQRKSESAVEAGRVLRFTYCPEIFEVNCLVQASMKDKSYIVKVGVISNRRGGLGVASTWTNSYRRFAYLL